MSAGVPSTRVFARDESAVTRRVSGETVIVPVRHDVADLGAIYVLNETGSWIWEHIDGARSESDLVDALVGEFDVTPDQAAQDVTALLNDLSAERLVRSVGGPG
jgi:hypothetical protein